jgi:hypothetical protein
VECLKSSQGIKGMDSTLETTIHRHLRRLFQQPLLPSTRDLQSKAFTPLHSTSSSTCPAVPGPTAVVQPVHGLPSPPPRRQPTYPLPPAPSSPSCRVPPTHPTVPPPGKAAGLRKAFQPPHPASAPTAAALASRHPFSKSGYETSEGTLQR